MSHNYQTCKYRGGMDELSAYAYRVGQNVVTFIPPLSKLCGGWNPIEGSLGQFPPSKDGIWERVGGLFLSRRLRFRDDRHPHV